MLERLKKKWQVDGFRLILILIVFAVAGTSTAFLTRQITRWLELDSSSGWYWALKAGVLLFGYWIVLLLVAIPFGQFPFFWNYVKRVGRKVFGRER